jgi:transcriptional regulator with XRE-family HTH domain
MVHKIQYIYVTMQQESVTQKPYPETECYDRPMHPGGRPTTKPRTALGQRLAQARERAGISQAELAERLGTNQQAIAYWERHATWFRSDLLVQLTEILGVSADELLGTRPPRRMASKPVGKARQLFEKLSKLPRRQQEKVIAILEPFVSQHSEP